MEREADLGEEARGRAARAEGGTAAPGGTVASSAGGEEKAWVGRGEEGREAVGGRVKEGVMVEAREAWAVLVGWEVAKAVWGAPEGRVEGWAVATAGAEGAGEGAGGNQVEEEEGAGEGAD